MEANSVRRNVLGLVCVLGALLAIARGEQFPKSGYVIGGQDMRGMGGMIGLDWSLPSGCLEFSTSKHSSSMLPDDFVEYIRKLKLKGKTGSGTDASVLLDEPGFECKRRSVELFLMVNHLHDGESHCRNAALEGRVNHVFGRNLAKCAPIALEEIEMHPQPEYERKFDTFFGKLHGVDANDNDELFAALRSNNLIDREMNLKGAIESVEGKRQAKTNYASRVEGFFKKECFRFRKELGLELDLVNLWKVMQKGTASSRVNKLLEYDHVCWYTQEHRKEFSRKLASSLGETPGLLTKFTNVMLPSY
jgi:hypothetical protein